MLALTFRQDEYAFIYHAGKPIGAIRVGKLQPGGLRTRLPLHFAGAKDEFEVLRPKVVAYRYGPQELERLEREFLAQPRSLPRRDRPRTLSRPAAAARA